MKTIIILLSIMFPPMVWSGTPIYHCNGAYTDTPCGKKVMVRVSEPTCGDRINATERYYKDKLLTLEAEYDRREFELVKSYISGARFTQTNIVSATAGASAGASTGSTRQHNDK